MLKSLRDITRVQHFDSAIKSEIERLASELSTQGEIRQSIECLRFLLDTETDPFARSRIFVSLAKNYRVLLQMKNVRYEIDRAFEALNMKPPRNTLRSTLRSLMYRVLWRFKNVPASWDFHMNELYVEVGLCAYYLRENLTMLQASSQSRYFAFRSQHPLQLVNWYGGSACVYRLLGMKRKALKYLDAMHQIAEQHTGETHAKSLVWGGLYHEYDNNVVGSVALFEKIVTEHYRHLSIYDLRLVALTLSCQQMVRGKFKECLAIFTLPQFHMCLLEGYHGLANSVDWYQIVALMATGRREEAESIIADHKYVLSSSDEERWAVTLFIGQCLLAESTGTPRKDYVFTLIRRFNDLKLHPRNSFFEAAFYWVGKSRSLLKLYQVEKTPELAQQMEESLNELSIAARADYVKVHEHLLRALWAKECANTTLYEHHKQIAQQLAERVDSDWVRAELTGESYAMSA